MGTLGDKKNFRLSNTTLWRERPPTSPEIANKGNPNMAIDFSKQKAVVPERLGQTTRYGENDRNFRPMNGNGKPFALDTMVGGSFEDETMPFGPRPPKRPAPKGR
jgi:hypothetical protein